MLKPIKNKKSKIKQKRRRIALLIILLIVVWILYATFHIKSYEKEYQVGDFKIQEKYDKELSTYSFIFERDNTKWQLVTEEKAKRKKKLIESVELLEEENTRCIIPRSEKLAIYPQCIEENELIDYHLVNDQMKEKLEEQYFKQDTKKSEDYEKITIKNIDNNTYYIWNYKGFYRIDSNKKENIKLFEKDIYNVSGISSVKDYLVIPDYNESYYFNKFYLINMKDGSNTTWNFDQSIYFDGYYLGTHNNSLFYMDKKMKVEWELFPKKKKMRKVGTEAKNGKILINDEWEKISVNKIMNDNKKFEQKVAVQYEIENGLIANYGDTKKQLSRKKVKEIVGQLSNKVYYLVEDSLYYYSEATGEVEVMSYFEWNFNYKNMIFIRENK